MMSEPFGALVEKWRAIFRAQGQAQPSRDDLERREAERERAQARAYEEHLAVLIAYNGAAFPGDEVGEPCLPRAEPKSLPGSWWIRW